MMFCPDCQTDLDDVPLGVACPGCGGQKRSALAQAEAAVVFVGSAAGSFSITRDDHRPWTEQWQTILHCLEELRVAYSPRGETLGTVEIKSRVETFFVECDHLRDWLKHDLSALHGVTADDIRGYALRSSPALSTCYAVCNTHKHHTRDRGRTEAQIREISVSSSGARVAIEIDWASPSATTVDALGLAEDCVQAWSEFFKRFNIVEP